MSVDGYSDILEQHWDSCEDCQKNKYARIEDCPDFKKYMAKLEAQADYEYERQKEENIDSD